MLNFSISMRLPAHACRLLAAVLLVPITMAARPVEAQSSAPRQRFLTPRDADTLTLRDAGRRIAYGADSLNFGDLRLPPGLKAGERAPVAVVVHGGCWISSFADLRNTAALADALAAAGVATWNVEYRRADHPGGGWPGTFLDVSHATDYVRTLARQYPLDTTRVVAVGHSAGAHLALWLAGRRQLPPSSPVTVASPLALTGAVSLGGVTDLEEASVRVGGLCGSGIAKVLGGPLAEHPDRVRLASPIRQLPLGVPTVHVSGEFDPISPDSVRRAYVQAATKAGDPVPVNVTTRGSHFEVIAPFTEDGAEAIRQTLRLLGITPK